MECPGCKDEDAYVGLNSVDCLNPECTHFNESYLEEKLEESEYDFTSFLDDLDFGIAMWISEGRYSRKSK